MKYAEYREKVKACRSSGMGEHRWCEAQGIKYETYHSWRERVRRREGAKLNYASFEEQEVKVK